MPSRVFPLVALGCAIFCSSDRACGQSLTKATLSGRITNPPLQGGFSVKLKPIENNPLVLYEGYSTQTASDGAFVFQDVEPGKYVLMAEGAGFMPTEYGKEGPGQSGTPIELKPGQHRKGVVITVTPKHVVCGKVTDEHGNPLPKVEAYAFAHSKDSMWLVGGVYTHTDEDGNYRLPTLEPGEYFLEAGMSTWFFGSKNLTQSEAESLANAEPVQVGREDGVGCRENIRMGPRLGYRGYKIRGRIAEDPSLAGKDLVLSLLEVNRTGVTRVVPPTETLNPGPSFDLWPVPAGHYRLILSRGRFPQNGFAGQPSFTVLSSQEITVVDADVNGITVAPDPLASLAGQVKLEDITPAKACPTHEKSHIRIQKDDDGQFQDIEIAADGKFLFQYLQSGIYTVRAYPFLRGTVYVKSMLLDGHSIQGRKLPIDSPGSHALEMVLSGDRVNASGHITPSEPAERYEREGSHPKASVSGKIANVINGNTPWVKLWAMRFNSDRSYEYSTKPDADGNFRFDNVDPGLYLLLSQGPGYTLSEYGASHPGVEGTAVTLRAGEHLEGLTWSASPKRPCICGRVTEADGRPLPNVPVFAWFQSKAKGYMVLPGVSTDSAGNFDFLDLKPGRYFIWTNSSVFSPNGEVSVERRSYFPSSPSLDDAQFIDVGFKPDAECKHNIQMRTSATFHVRGKLPEHIPHAPEEVFDLALIETNAFGVKRWAHSKQELEPGDAFDFANVRPGRYWIQLTGPHKRPAGLRSFSGPCGLPSPHVVATHEMLIKDEVVIKDSDLNDFAIDFKNSLVSVTGEVRFENIPKEWTGFTVEAQSLALALEDALCPVSSQLNSQGAFAFESMEPGTYRLDFPFRTPLYVKSILLDGRPIEGRHIILTPGKAVELNVVVSGDGGEVDADVTPSGPPAEEYRYEEPCRPKMPVVPHAFLIPDPVPADGSGVITGAFTTARYIEIGGVPPGTYRAVGGENFNLLTALSPFGDSPWKDPKFLAAVAALGRRVEIAAAQKVKLSLPSITVDLQNLLAQQEREVRIDDHCAASCSYDGFWNGAETAGAHKP